MTRDKYMEKDEVGFWCPISKGVARSIQRARDRMRDRGEKEIGPFQFVEKAVLKMVEEDLPTVDEWENKNNNSPKE